MSDAVDPKTGLPYSFATGYGAAAPMDWTIQGQSFREGDKDRDSGSMIDNFGYYNQPDFDPEWLKSLGYTGGPTQILDTGNIENQTYTQNSEFAQWLKDSGLQLGMSELKGGGSAGQNQGRLQAFKDGNPFGDEHNWTFDENNAGFGAGMALMAAFMGNYAGAAGALGGASAASGGAEGLSGMDLAADAAAGTGNNIAYAGGQLGDAAGGIANSGSDAHFYNNPTSQGGANALGNMGGAGTATVPTLGGSGSSLWQNLAKDGLKSLLTPQKGGTSPAQMMFGGGGSRLRQQLMADALREGQQKPATMPGWIPGG